jgi:hypothetical protein
MIDTLKKDVRQYLKDREEWEVKWGNLLLLDEASRPAEMPPMPLAPYELNLWYQCDKYQSLLCDGGILDQPYITWTLIQVCGSVVSEQEYVEFKRKELNEKLKKK